MHAATLIALWRVRSIDIDLWVPLDVCHLWAFSIDGEI
jgi:hypothetical protein